MQKWYNMDNAGPMAKHGATHVKLFLTTLQFLISFAFAFILHYSN